MTDKTKNYLKWSPSILVALFIINGAIMKFANAAQLAKLFSYIGMEHRMTFFGIAEITFISLFLWPKTMRLGFFLLTGYFGGAMAVELSLGKILILPALILTIIWIAAYLRDGALFKPSQVRMKSFSPEKSEIKI